MMMQEAQQSLPQTASDSASRLWTDAQLQHLHWYLSCTTEPQGSCPVADKAPASEEGDKAEESSPAKEASARGPPTVGLNPLICYLEREVSRQKLSRRVSANRRGEDIGLEGNGLKGQEAVDAYVSQLVTVIRNFPYKLIVLIKIFFLLLGAIYQNWLMCDVILNIPIKIINNFNIILLG